MKLLMIAFIPILMFACSQSLANSKCDSVVKSPFYSALDEVTQEEITDRFIGYIESLFEAQILELKDLVFFKESLLNGEAKNPLTRPGLRSLNIQAKPHIEGIAKFLDPVLFDKDIVIQQITKIEEKAVQVKQEKGVVEKETKSLGLPIKFNRISKNGFWISRSVTNIELARGLEAKGEPVESIIQQIKLMEEQRMQQAKESRGKKEYEPLGLTRIELDQDIEVMSMPVTIMQWLEVMGEIPRMLFIKHVGLEERIDVGEVAVPANYPVTGVTWWSAAAFANRLSELHGYKPYYDLSRTKLHADWQGRTGSYKGGDFEAENISYSLDAPGGDPYKGEGYRLPTTFESEYLIRELGKFPRVEEALLSVQDEVERKSLEFFPGEDFANLAVQDSDFVVLEGGKFFGLKTNITEHLLDQLGTYVSALSTHNEYSYRTVRNPMYEPGSNGHFRFDIEQVGDRLEYNAGEEAYRTQRALSGYIARRRSSSAWKILKAPTYKMINTTDGSIGFRLVRSLPDSSKSK